MPHHVTRSTLTPRRLLPLALALIVVAPACADPTAEGGLPDITREGELISYAASPGMEVCGRTVEAANQIAGVAMTELGGGPPDAHAVYYVLTPEEMLDLSTCPLDEDGVARSCVHGNTYQGQDVVVYSPEAGNLHELVHVAHNLALPDSMPILSEGLAMLRNPGGIRFQQYGYGWNEHTLAELDAKLEASAAGGLDYLLAWYLAYVIVQQGGMEALVDIWMALPYGSTGEELRDAYADIVGSDLVTDLDLGSVEDAEFCTMPICPEPTRGFVDGEWMLEGATSCDDDNAIGWDDQGDLLSFETLRVETAGDYHVQTNGEGPVVWLIKCGAGCDGQVGFNEGADEVVELEAADYLVIVDHDHLDRPRQMLTITAQ